MNEQLSMKAEYGQARDIADGSMGGERSLKDLERGAMRKGALPISVVAREGTTIATCGDTAGLMLPMCKGQVKVSSVPSFVPIWKARITLSDFSTTCVAQAGPVPSKAFRAGLYLEGSWKLRPSPGSLMISITEAL